MPVNSRNNCFFFLIIIEIIETLQENISLAKLISLARISMMMKNTNVAK